MTDRTKKPGYEEGYAGEVDADYLDALTLDDLSLKKRTYEMVRAAKGHTVLDVGCGPASDTLALGRIVGPTGKVMGIDHDPKMIATAGQRTTEAGLSDMVEHRLADGGTLPFADNTFDSCRSERVFQHVEDAAQLLSEMIRVTKPGGYVVVADTDHSTHGTSTNNDDMDMRFRALALQALKNPHVGRKLFKLMKLAGLVEVESNPVLRTWTDLEKWRPIALDLGLPIGLKLQAWTQEEATQYENDLQQLHDQGAFYAQVGYILTAGRKSAQRVSAASQIPPASSSSGGGGNFIPLDRGRDLRQKGF
jgi:ubiquinone/menaquinone biosynthesis C-methylase UbiE